MGPVHLRRLTARLDRGNLRRASALVGRGGLGRLETDGMRRKDGRDCSRSSLPRTTQPSCSTV